MRTPKRVRSRFREWWPEIIWALFAITFALGALHSPSGFIYVGVFSVVFWAMGYRHRRLPMQATLDGVRQDVTVVREDVGEIRQTMHAAVEALSEQAPAERPGLHLV